MEWPSIDAEDLNLDFMEGFKIKKIKKEEKKQDLIAKSRKEAKEKEEKEKIKFVVVDELNIVKVTFLVTNQIILT